ncbi:MAG: UTP--glucose-1-phosphate uridylyltransferase [Polyangia bacterium]
MAATDDSNATLSDELDALDPAVRARLGATFDPAWLIARAKILREQGAAANNRVSGGVSAPRPDELAPLRDADRARLEAMGNEALGRGEIALCVLAGGMATRMGGVVKALVEIEPGLRFLDARLGEQRAVSHRSGKPLPVWLMTSEATDAPIRDALAKADAPSHVATFRQGNQLRLDQRGRLFRDAQGAPSLYATGHGDVVDALRSSHLLDEFRERGGKWVLITNLDNLGASVDPLYAGAAIDSGAQLLVEAAHREPTDKGGAPVRHGGRIQILEEFRLPEGFDPMSVPVMSTNTMWVSADALATTDVPWSWFTVEKKVDGRTAIQFERLVQELTAVLETRYVEVPREGDASRFLPVKDPAELERRRPVLLSALRARGFMP